DSDPGAPVLTGVRGVCTEQAHLSGRAHPEALQHLDRGGLACAVGTQQADDLATIDVEGHVGEDVAVAVAHPQVPHVHDRCCISGGVCRACCLVRCAVHR